jgi:hypothetical protein
MKTKWLVRVLVTVIIGGACVVLARGDDGDDIGPAGPIGLTGPASTVPGPAGKNGTNSTIPGPVGKAGQSITGPAGQDASIDHTLTAGLGFGMRLYDARHYSLNTLYTHDFVHSGNSVFGLITIKLGKSWEERRIDKLERLLK